MLWFGVQTSVSVPMATYRPQSKDTERQDPLKVTFSKKALT